MPIGSRTGLFALSGPQGVQSVEDMMRSTGRRFFVHASRGNGGTTSGFGDSPDRPFLTCDQAINVIGAAVTAGTLDASDSKHVLTMPGHTETISDATSLVMDQANISLIGDGRGTARPTITFDNASGNIPISGVNCSISNFLFLTTGTIDVTAGITVSAVSCRLKDIEMIENANDSQFVDAISCSGCDRLEVDNFHFFGLVGGDATQSALQVTDTSQFVWMHDCVIIGEFVTGGIETGAVLDVMIERMAIEQRGSAVTCAAISTTAKGFMRNCEYRTATNTGAGMDAVTPGGDLQFYNIRIVNLDGEIGAMHPISDLDVTDNTGNTNSPFEFSDMTG